MNGHTPPKEPFKKPTTLANRFYKGAENKRVLEHGLEYPQSRAGRIFSLFLMAASYTWSGHSFFPLEKLEWKTPSVYASIKSWDLQTKSHTNHHEVLDEINEINTFMIIWAACARLLRWHTCTIPDERVAKLSVFKAFSAQKCALERHSKTYKQASLANWHLLTMFAK